MNGCQYPAVASRDASKWRARGSIEASPWRDLPDLPYAAVLLYVASQVGLEA